jgi:hypothetical protein
VYVALVHMFRGYTEIGVSGKALHWHKYWLPPFVLANPRN